MVQLQKIFVATDLSARADLAIREAHTRAASEHALRVCHVLPSWQASSPLFPQNVQGLAELAARREQLVQEAVASRVKELTGRDPGSYSLVVEAGEPYAVIVEQAEDWGADLIVLGGRGEATLSHALLGGVVEKVVRLAHCPVLVVKPQAGSRAILAGTDFSASALPAVRAAGEEARRVGGRVSVAYCIDVPVATTDFLVAATGLAFSAVLTELEGDAAARLRAALAATGIDGTSRVLQGRPAAALVREAEAMNADLLVVGNRGHTTLHRVTLGSVAEAIVQSAPCSVLVVRLPPREPVASQ